MHRGEISDVRPRLLEIIGAVRELDLTLRPQALLSIDPVKNEERLFILKPGRVGEGKLRSDVVNGHLFASREEQRENRQSRCETVSRRHVQATISEKVTLP